MTNGAGGGDDARAFILAHTAKARAPLVPELILHLASEATPLWKATEAWLEERAIEPPYWAFAWAGGQALARYVLDTPAMVQGRTVVDVGAGSGLVAIAAKRAGAARVIALDRDPMALVATTLNAEANGESVETRLATHARDVDADVILAGDVFYDRHESPKLLADLEDAARRGALVVVGCPGRVASPLAATLLRAVEVPDSLELEGKESVVSRVMCLSA